MATPTVTPDVTQQPTTTTQPDTSQQGSPQGAQPPQQQGQDSQGLRQLRETYENLKKEFEPWQKLGIKPDQVGQFQGVYTKLHQEIAVIGRELGYSDAEIAEAMAEDPVRTLDFLRNEALPVDQRGPQPPMEGQNLNELVAQYVQHAIGPIQERENFRMTNEANAVFERTVHQLATDLFKKEGIDYNTLSEDEKFFISTGVSEVMKYDQDALRELKYQGKTAGIQKAFQEFVSAWDKAYLARSGRDKARVQPPRPGQPASGQNQPPWKGKTLDELAANPELINEKYR